MPMCALANLNFAGRRCPFFTPERMTLGKKLMTRLGRASICKLLLTEKEVKRSHRVSSQYAAQLQMGMTGNTTFFPVGDPVAHVQELPPRKLSDTLCVVFTGANADDMRGAQILRVVPAEYLEEMAFLQRVCAPFRTVQIRPEGLAGVNANLWRP